MKLTEVFEVRDSRKVGQGRQTVCLDPERSTIFLQYLVELSEILESQTGRNGAEV